MASAPFARNWNSFDRAFDKVVREALAPTRATAQVAVSQPIPVDIYTTENEAVLTAALPGVQAGDLDLKVHQNQISISGRVANPATSESAAGARWLAKELWSGEFRRTIALPFPVNVDAVEATFEHGLLHMVLPKAESARPRTISLSPRADVHAVPAAETPAADAIPAETATAE